MRLQPGATEKISFSKSPVTSVRINDDRYRGGAWLGPAIGEVIVVGDSQIIVVGGAENETFSAVLQTSLGGSTVLRNLGVPTYGPREYHATDALAFFTSHPVDAMLIGDLLLERDAT